MRRSIALLPIAGLTALCAWGAETADPLEVPPAPYTVRYAPADGSTTALNPPAFLWLPVKGREEYELQYSQDPGFPPGKTEIAVCRMTIHVPRRTLAPGTWHWRFGVDGPSGRTFSAARAFTVPADAAPVPFPDVCAAVSKLSGARPRDFLRAEDLERCRALGRGPLKGYLEELRKDCRRYLGEPLLPEPAFLPKDKQEWIVAYTNTFRTTRPFNSGMVACASMYLLSGEREYGEEARRRLLHLAGWDPNGSTSLSHNDEPGTELVRLLPRVYDWIHPLLSEEERKRCRDALAVRIPQVYRALKEKPFEVHPYESHAMDYYIGDLLEACICMAGELPVEEMLEYVLLQLWSPFFPPYGGDEGGWCEGPSYWQWSTSTFLRDFALAQQDFGVDLTRKPWLRNTPYFKLYSNPPYSKMSPFGDGQSSSAGGADTMHKLGVTLSNPYALWFAAEQRGGPRSLERFLYWAPDLEAKPPSDLPQARCFFDVGLACMHSDLADGRRNVHFMLRSSPFGSISHSYADQNAFILHAYGEPLAIASGYYPYYGSPHHATWSRETRASNSILVDGQGQKIRDWDSRGRIARFETGDLAHYALGDATEAYEGRLKAFRRHALFLRPLTRDEEPAVVLLDDLSGSKPSTFQWLLHSTEEMRVDEGAARVEVRRNAAHLRVLFLEPSGLKLRQTDRFTVPPEDPSMPSQHHLTAEMGTPAERCRFLTVLLPYREGEEGKLPSVKLLEASGFAALEVRSKAARRVAAFRTGSEPAAVSIEGIKTEAQVLLAVWDLEGRLKGKVEIGGPRDSGGSR